MPPLVSPQNQSSQTSNAHKRHGVIFSDGPVRPNAPAASYRPKGRTQTSIPEGTLVDIEMSDFATVKPSPVLHLPALPENSILMGAPFKIPAYSHKNRLFRESGGTFAELKDKAQRASKNYVEIEEHYDVSKRRFSQMGLTSFQLPNSEFNDKQDELKHKRNIVGGFGGGVAAIGAVIGTIGCTAFASDSATEALGIALKGSGFGVAALGVLIGASGYYKYTRQLDKEESAV